MRTCAVDPAVKRRPHALSHCLSKPGRDLQRIRSLPAYEKRPSRRGTMVRGLPRGMVHRDLGAGLAGRVEDARFGIQPSPLRRNCFARRMSRESRQHESGSLSGSIRAVNFQQSGFLASMRKRTCLFVSLDQGTHAVGSGFDSDETLSAA